MCYILAPLVGNNIAMRALYLALVALVVSFIMPSATLVDMLPTSNIEQIIIYSNTSSDYALYNGVTYEYCCTTTDFDTLYSSCSSICGISVWLNSDNLTVEQLLSCFDMSYMVEMDNHIYGYCNNLGNSIIIDMHRVNVHIVAYDNYYVVGTPILLGSY